MNNAFRRVSRCFLHGEGMTNACPHHAKNVPFDKKTKPGRPQLAPLAFIRASNFTSLLEIEDDAELVDEALNDNNINNNLQLEPQFDNL